jgi:cytochrome c oxidase subunit 2
MRRFPVRLAVFLVSTAVVVGLAACGGDSKKSGFPEPASAQAREGMLLIQQNGCVGCHSLDGSKRSGPTWKGLPGSTVTLADGTTVVADTAYLTRAIQEPKSQVVAGYPSIMPTFAHMTDAQVAAMVAYLQQFTD